MSNDTAVTLRLPQDVLDRLTELAAEDGVSRSLLIRRFLLTSIYQRLILDEELPSGGGLPVCHRPARDARHCLG